MAYSTGEYPSLNVCNFYQFLVESASFPFLSNMLVCIPMLCNNGP